MLHKPVLLQEVLENLQLRPGNIVVDGTLGSGGHAAAVLNSIGPTGRLIGLDQDPEAIARCQSRFANTPNVSLHHENFRNLDKILGFLNISSVNAVILDIGFSSDQLEDASRGFSFERTGPLDMRMNPEQPVTASDLVNDLSKEDLENLFFTFGGERRSRKFAAAICRRREEKPIETTDDLAGIILQSVGGPQRQGKRQKPGWMKRHPATKIFQALRIAVNQELESLAEGLRTIWPFLARGGRMAVISFHSLEDRIVKNQFRTWCREGSAGAVFKKPLTASREEMADNPRARSAKLRIVEKTDAGIR